jgi:hypothetical protein
LNLLTVFAKFIQEIEMVTLHPEFVGDGTNQAKVVLLPFPEWEEVVAELEELDDIRAYDAAKASDEKAIPFDQAVREIRESNKA